MTKTTPMSLDDARVVFTDEQLADLASKATGKANVEAARRYKAGPEREACAQFLAGVYYSEYVNPPKLTPVQKIAALTKERDALQSRLDAVVAVVSGIERAAGDRYPRIAVFVKDLRSAAVGGE